MGFVKSFETLKKNERMVKDKKGEKSQTSMFRSYKEPIIA